MGLRQYDSIHLKFILQLLLLIICVPALSQKTFRRHFIIAYDVSGTFVRSEKDCPVYEQALVNLFENKSVGDANEKYEDNLKIEKKNQVPFFDKEKDEISFFHFNVAKSEMERLKWLGSNYDKKAILSEFNKTFIKHKDISWTSFVNKGKTDVGEYINTLFNYPVTPPVFGSGVSMSYFVFPLVMNKIDSTQYSEEYILILVSDFLSGSMFGNSKDLLRLKDIYEPNESVNSPVTYIKDEINYLSSQFYKIDFFNYSFCPISNNKGSTNSIGFISYKIKPKIGVLTPEDVALFVDGDLKLDQQGFQSVNFRISDTKIKFTHNKNLVPVELALTISMPFGNKEQIIFQDVVAVRDKADEWVSEYTNNSDLMKFDSNNLTYYIPALKIKLDSIVNKREFENLNFKYTFKTKYEIANTQPLNFVYFTERGLPIESINYTTKTMIIIMYYLLPILVFLGLIIFLFYYSKPTGLLFRIDGYLDSYEIIDYKTFGKLHTPFKAWDTDKQRFDHLLVKGELKYKSRTFPFNWNPFVYLRLQNILLPEGFELFLKQNTEDIKEFGSDSILTIKKGKHNKLSFVVGIRQNDITRKVLKPELVKFTVEAVVKDSVLFIKSDLRETIEYNFHIGQDLKDVWVGFDPGTTGSCVTVGSDTENIILVEDWNKIDIIPSVLVFKKTEQYENNKGEIPKNIYEHGTKSLPLSVDTSNKYQGFRSIKKLIGFDNSYKVEFANGNTLMLKGKQLASLLIQGLFNDTYSFINKLDLKGDYYKRDGIFNPLRAVVAIPNNFTLRKIQDMIECIETLGKFKEIRYVYEAEAVLFYYLSNSRQLNKDDNNSDSEAILVFDMGGATINATVVTSSKIMENERPKYYIDILGKIGYGIGGDTIDYCIIKFILSNSEEFEQLKSINIKKMKDKLAGLAFLIKKEITENYYSNKEYLIPASRLEYFINNELGLSLDINDETSEMYKYFIKISGEFKLFKHPLFLKTIYNNVRDAINEVVDLSGITYMDKVIFSGRSTSFPMIKETVEKQLKAKVGETKYIALKLKESKIAVAMGACWYGINKNSVRLNNLKTNAAFGFKRTMSADKTDVKFYELVEMGCTFDTKSDGIDSFEGSEDVSSDFSIDGGKVNFFQIMGKNAEKILSEGQKHKFSKITSIKLDQITSKIAMKVNENDEVECVVKLETNQIIRETGIVSDQEIDEANEEHYTWIVN